MKIDEAILSVLAERNGGLRTEQIADIINRRKLHVRETKKKKTVAPRHLSPFQVVIYMNRFKTA